MTREKGKNTASIRAAPEAKIIQTLSEESVSSVDPNNIDDDCSTIRFCIALVRAYVRLRQLDPSRIINSYSYYCMKRY